MANESSADFNINFTPPTQFANNPTYEAFIRLYQKLSSFEAANAYYGITSDTYEDALEVPLNEIIYSNGTGRWSWSGSMDSNYNRNVQEILSNNLTLSILPSNDTIDASETYGTFYRTKSIPELYKKLFDKQSENDLIFHMIDEINQYISNITSAFKNLVKDSDDITIYELNYNDYESGADYLEVNGSATLTYSPISNSFNVDVADGETISSPSRQDLIDQGYMSEDEDTEDMIEQLSDLISDDLKALNKTDQDKINDVFFKPLTTIFEQDLSLYLDDAYSLDSILDELSDNKSEDADFVEFLDKFQKSITTSNVTMIEAFPKLIKEYIAQFITQ